VSYVEVKERVMKKNRWPPAPFLVGVILGPMVEISLRQSLSMGGPLIFFTCAITVAFLLSAIILVIMSVKFLKRIPKEILGDKSDF